MNEKIKPIREVITERDYKAINNFNDTSEIAADIF